WRTSPCRAFVDDAIQEVLLECIKPGGALDGVERGRGRFRSFLKGVANNVARRVERRRQRDRLRLRHDSGHDDVIDDEENLSHAFDRFWALGLIAEARRLLAERARHSGGEAARRVDLLRLRFEEGLPVRDIAALWQEDADVVHSQKARALREFKAV